MNFNRHSNLEGQHAFLGASKYHWINYTDDKIADSYVRFLATQKGTVLHAFAAQCTMIKHSERRWQGWQRPQDHLRK